MNGTDAATSDNDVNGGCESYRFIPGHDEMALPAEIGLYYDFKVDADMIPYGCPGFENFNLLMWKSKGYHYQWSTINHIKAAPNCPKNNIQNPPGSTPMHQILEDYADHQENWIRDFVPAFEKMLANGYMSTELHDGPDQWTNVRCSSKGAWFCFKTDNFSRPFYIVSDLDQRVLQHNQQGVLQLSSKRSSHDDTQLWHWTAQEDLLVNVHTNLPLVIGGLWSWSFRSQASWYHPQPGHKVLASGNQCIDRGWGKHDVSSVISWNCWGGPVQHWSLEVMA